MSEVVETPILPSEAQMPAISTNAVRSMLRGSMLKTVPHRLQKHLDLYKEDSGHKLLRSWVDALHPSINFKFKPRDLKVVVYKRSIPLTSMSYEVYGTTSLWWLILRVNGIMHPDELNDGEKLKIPSLDAVKALILPSAPSLKGSVVTV